MLKQEDTGGLGGGSKNNWSRVCHACRSAACRVYCRADSAYLCSACDARIHAANKLSSRHERVLVCEACERVPAAFLCKADAASLCATCDADIHSANPLAARHHRVPILPIPSTLYGPPATDSHPGGGGLNLCIDDEDFLTRDEDDCGEEMIDEDDENEAASWLLFNNPVKNGKFNNQGGGRNNNNGLMFGGGAGEGVDEYLDLVEYGENQFGDHYNNNKYEQDQQQQHYVVPQKGFGGGGDSVVPTARVAGDRKDCKQLHHHHQSFQLGLDYEGSNTGYGYPASMSHSASNYQVSVSSMEVGVVPDSMVSDVSISPHARPPKGTIDLFSSAPLQAPQQLTPMDREARVLRYREKKKTRKFEKTIRYASRKAYAETRPRIKGRFAKRTEVDVEVDQMLSTALMTENGYSIVPSF